MLICFRVLYQVFFFFFVTRCTDTSDSLSCGDRQTVRPSHSHISPSFSAHIKGINVLFSRVKTNNINGVLCVNVQLWTFFFSALRELNTSTSVTQLGTRKAFKDSPSPPTRRGCGLISMGLILWGKKKRKKKRSEERKLRWQLPPTHRKTQWYKIHKKNKV